jgi:hypothetical protein
MFNYQPQQQQYQQFQQQQQFPQNFQQQQFPQQFQQPQYVPVNIPKQISCP